MRTLVLASGAGTNFQAVLSGISAGNITNCSICKLIVDRPETGAARIASGAGIPVETIDSKSFSTRSEFDSALFDSVVQANPDLILALGFMKVLSKPLVEAFPNRIINIHPSLLPAFPGLHAVKQALDYGAKVSGVTVHFVDASVDTGPIIAQESLPIPEGITPELLHQLIRKVEHRILIDVVNLVCSHQISVDGRKVSRQSKE